MGPKILVVDDSDNIRAGIRVLVTSQRPKWEICGEARTGEEAVEKIRALQPDVVVLDVSLPGMSGWQALHRIRDADPGVRVILFSVHDSDTLMAEAKQSGAQGYVLKTKAASDLIRAIESVHAGGAFFGGAT
jgi:DNA-binding NarL/FixJ family response regulator